MLVNCREGRAGIDEHEGDWSWLWTRAKVANQITLWKLNPDLVVSALTAAVVHPESSI